MVVSVAIGFSGFRIGYSLFSGFSSHAVQKNGRNGPDARQKMQGMAGKKRVRSGFAATEP